MRYLFTIVLLSVSFFCFSQDSLINGIEEFKKQDKQDAPDFSKAYSLLQNEVNQHPEDAQLRYFLGYTIDRMNAEDRKKMIELKKQLTIKSSEQFEIVNKIEPIYKGELYLLDPYTKISSIWGSLAESYLSRKLIDSAKWAFKEGKKRGGFLESVLEYNRQLLNSCDRNSILITSGDIITISIWYLQAIENFRNDITTVDVNLINAPWYPKYLKYEKNLKIDLSDEQIDSINYKEWKPQTIEIINPKNTTQKFSWELRPTYMENYILKGDQILCNILKQNFFDRPIYFLYDSDSSNNLFLTPHLQNEGMVDRVVDKLYDSTTNFKSVYKNLNFYNIKNLKREDIIKSRGAIKLLNGFRIEYFATIDFLLRKGSYDEARVLFKQMESRFDLHKLPFSSDLETNYFNALNDKINKNSQ